jgi:hypothetical protein
MEFTDGHVGLSADPANPGSFIVLPGTRSLEARLALASALSLQLEIQVTGSDTITMDHSRTQESWWIDARFISVVENKAEKRIEYYFQRGEQGVRVLLGHHAPGQKSLFAPGWERAKKEGGFLRFASFQSGYQTILPFSNFVIFRAGSVSRYVRAQDSQNVSVKLVLPKEIRNDLEAITSEFQIICSYENALFGYVKATSCRKVGAGFSFGKLVALPEVT